MSEDTARDSLNWYSYCYSNPIKYIDPWGLFGWNENDDHWFALRYETESAGGKRFMEREYEHCNGFDLWGKRLFSKNTNGVEIRSTW